MAILNRGLKINNNPTNYEVAGWVLPTIARLLDRMLARPDLDLWGEAIHEVVECLVGIMNCSHIGLFVLDNNIPGMPFRVMFAKALQVLLQSIPSIRHYPRLEECLLEMVTCTNKEIMEYVYWLPDGELPGLYHRLLMAVHDLTLEYVKEYRAGNKPIEDKMLKSFDCVRTYFTFHNAKAQL